MSYANAIMSPAERLRAATAAIGFPALIGAGVIAGLAVTVMPDGPLESDPIAINIPIVPPPPPEPDEQPQPTSQPETVVSAPVPDIEIPRDPIVFVDPPDVNISDTIVTRVPDIIVDIPAPPAPPRVEPAFDPVGPVPRNGPAGWISNNDYPSISIRREHEGSTGYRLVIGSNGRVDACQITRSSGHSVLDNATCRLLQRRARFDAAKNNRGEAVVGAYTGSVTWQLPRR